MRVRVLRQSTRSQSASLLAVQRRTNHCCPASKQPLLSPSSVKSASTVQRQITHCCPAFNQPVLSSVKSPTVVDAEATNPSGRSNPEPRDRRTPDSEIRARRRRPSTSPVHAARKRLPTTQPPPSATRPSALVRVRAMSSTNASLGSCAASAGGSTATAAGSPGCAPSSCGP